MSPDSVKTKMYLNALKLIFPYNNRLLHVLINHQNSGDHTDKISSQYLSYLWNRMPESELENLGLKEAQKDKFIQQRKEINPETEYALLLEKKIHLISRKDVGYPLLLNHIYNSPEILYIQGKKSLLGNQNIAVVGARNATLYGHKITEKIIENLKPYNFNIVSGLARGIDSCAHEVTVKNGMPTIAVLGAGHGSLEPKMRSRLIKNLMNDHLIISEYPYHTPGDKFTFPQRNRIISGLSLATIVIEAKERSGSLITAQLANEQGRHVFAVPGSLYNECSQGTNAYIQKGEAELFLNVPTMIESLNLNGDLP